MKADPALEARTGPQPNSTAPTEAMKDKKTGMIRPIEIEWWMKYSNNSSKAIEDLAVMKKLSEAEQIKTFKKNIDSTQRTFGDTIRTSKSPKRALGRRWKRRRKEEGKNLKHIRKIRSWIRWWRRSWRRWAMGWGRMWRGWRGWGPTWSPFGRT